MTSGLHVTILVMWNTNASFILRVKKFRTFYPLSSWYKSSIKSEPHECKPGVCSSYKLRTLYLPAQLTADIDLGGVKI